MRKILIVLGLLVSFGITSYADEAAHKELVEQLFTVTNMQEGFDSTCNEIIDMQIKSNPMMAPFKGAITDFFKKYMSWDSLKPEIINLYMQTFTEDELRDIVSFLSSPVGIMYTEKSFDLTLKCMDFGQKRVNENMGELEAMLAAEANKLLEEERNKAQETQESPKNQDEPTPSPTEK